MVNSATTINKTRRYERKLMVSDLDVYEVEHLIRLHPAAFSEVYHQRQINNIYFDTPDLNAYWDNVAGSQHRVKARIRWYGELQGCVSEGRLELKIKNGVVGHKLTAPVGPFSLDEKLDNQGLLILLREAELKPEVRRQILTMQPVLINRYARKYFLSADNSFRLTLDTEMEYMRFLSGRNRLTNRIAAEGQLVVEIKYGIVSDESAAAIAGYFPFRVTKSSKYVTGLSMIRSL